MHTDDSECCACADGGSAAHRRHLTLELAVVVQGDVAHAQVVHAVRRVAHHRKPPEARHAPVVPCN